jgi:hypothetical protein
VIKREYPGGNSDPFTYVAWLLAAYLSGAEDTRDFLPLLKELRQTVAFLDRRGKVASSSVQIGWAEGSSGSAYAAVSTDSDEALLKYAARVLGDLRRRYRLDGLHWPPELKSLRLLAASGGQARPILDGNRIQAILSRWHTTPPAG